MLHQPPYPYASLKDEKMKIIYEQNSDHVGAVGGIKATHTNITIHYSDGYPFFSPFCIQLFLWYGVDLPVVGVCEMFIVLVQVDEEVLCTVSSPLII